MKKILRLLKRRKNGGFTLVEVIVSCVLLGILILAVFGMITPVMDVIMRNDKNANGLMIAEAAEAYIDKNIKNSVYAAVFTNAQYSDLTDTITADHEAMKIMLAFLKDSDNSKIYDLKIIGIRWQEDKRLNQYKYMVTNITPKISDDGTKIESIKEESKVFEDCFYDNLYPDFLFEVLAYNEYPLDADKKPDKTQPIKSTRNVAIKTTIDVYSNPDMTALAAEGSGYADFINIRTPAINREDIYKLYSIEDGVDAMGVDIDVYTQLRTDDVFKADCGDTAHPETFIVYVTRKLKFVEPTPAAP